MVDETIEGAKIDPIGGTNQATNKTPGLNDENVDAARISPMSAVREEMQ